MIIDLFYLMNDEVCNGLNNLTLQSEVRVCKRDRDTERIDWSLRINLFGHLKKNLTIYI